MNDRMVLPLGALTLAEFKKLVLAIWADLSFDEAAKAALRRDGLPVDSMRLTGKCPFAVRLDPADPASAIVVTAGSSQEPELLADLWRLHFARRLRDARSS